MNNKKHRIYQIVLLVLWVILIVFFSAKCLDTGSESSNLSKKVGEVITKITGLNDDNTNNFTLFIRKVLGHFGFFLIFGVVSTLLFFSINELKLYIRIIINLSQSFIYAIISEFLLEANTTGRNASIGDVFIDYSGFIVGFFITVIISNFIRLESQKYEQAA